MPDHNVRSALYRITNGMITWLSIFLLGVQPILAQGVVPNAAATGGLSVTAAPNGVPLANIATPNAQGLSHNLYDRFNVDADGLVLNNTADHYAQTQLGGVVPGNANLATSGAARIILNEVVSANRSTLGGVVEVAGQSADVIVANPNGITCNGCGFIRTPRVVLTTGTPNITGGTLDGFTVNGGDITFGVNGADLSQVSLFDIISRQVTFDGAVTGQDVRVTTGRNSVDYATGRVTASPDDGSTAPDFAIDSTAVGGLYAGRISLLSTEAGVAVRAPREMAANAGAMTLTADGRLVIGRAQASGPATLRSTAAPVVVETSLFAGDAITLTGVSAEIIADATLVTEADLTIMADTVTLGTGAIAAAGMDGDGNLGTSGNLQITTDALLGTNAQIAVAGDAAVRADTITLNQTSAGQSVSVQGDLTVETTTLSTDGSTVAIGGNATIVGAPDLSISGGTYAIGGDLTVEADTLTTTATLETGGTASLTTRSGNLSNSGTVDAAAILTIASAGDLTTAGALTAGLTGTLTATGNLNNSGSIVTAGALTGTGANVFNSGPLGSSVDDVTLTTVGNITNTGLIYSGADLWLNLDGALQNNGADIIAERGITIVGASDARATSVLNRSANIEAITGSILIAAAVVENSQPIPNVVPETTVTTREGAAADFPDISHPENTSRVVEITTTTRMVAHNPNRPSRILAGDDLTIDASTITNTYSQIAANGDATLTAGTVTNTGQDLIETVVTETTSHYSERYCKRRIFGFCLSHGTRDLTRTQTETDTFTSSAVFATIEAGGTLSAAVSGYLTNNAVRGNATQIGLSSGARALATPPLIGTVNPNVILSRPALFRPSNTPRGPFLIETRPEFVDLARFLSSDYFLSRIGTQTGGYNANLTQRRFGDAYVEARLIQEQMFALTGRRTANDPATLRAVMQRLYDNALDSARALNLTPGVTLSPEHVAALTRPIIWLEEQTINGQPVLVPVVYMVSNAIDPASLAGAQIAAAQIDITAGATANSGRIDGTTGVQITTNTDLANTGGQIASDGDVTLNVGGALGNVSGQITGQNVGITAGSVDNSTAVIRDDTRFGTADRAQATATITATGNLTITADTDITAQGGQFDAGNTATLSAGDNITIGAVTRDTLRTQTFDGGHDITQTRTNDLAAVRAGDNITITAGDDITIAGADIAAGGGCHNRGGGRRDDRLGSGYAGG